MRFTINLLDPGSPGATPVTVETEPTLPVAALADELARVRGLPSDTPLFHGTTRLDPSLTLTAAGLREGISISIGAPGPDGAEPAGVVEVRIVGGAGAGTIHRLLVGEYDLGSWSGCRLRLPGPGPEVAARVRVTARGAVLVTACSPGVKLGDEELDPAADAPTPWLLGSQLSVGAALVEIAPVTRPRASITLSEDGFGREFNRPPRFVPPTAQSRFRLPSRPGDAPQAPVSLITVLLVPVVAAIVTVLVSGNWKLIFLGLLSPLGALLTRSGSRRRSLREHERRVQAYEEAMTRIGTDVDAALRTEQHARRLAHPDPAALQATATTPSDRLWERRWRDQDFLELRIGTGAIPSMVQVEDPDQDENRRTTVPLLSEVPATVPVRAAGVVGLVGDIGHAKWLVAEAAVLHSPVDLCVFVLSSAPAPQSEAAWGWTRWLPHTQPQGGDTYALIGNSTQSTARRVAELSALVAARTAAKAASGEESAGAPDVLVVLDGARKLRALPGVVGLLREGPAVGVYVICVDTDPRLLPEECRALITAEGPTLRLRVQNRPDVAGLRPDLPSPSWYDHVARGLAALRAGGDDEDSVLPSSARLLDLMALEPPDPDAVRSRWIAQPRSTRALLGVGLDGDFAVDIVRDGPHALIAGTTGSGKSELLQTLVASLAVVNRPDEMTFVLVDYKGGSAFAECADLPHTVGLVTDLDTHLVTRALVSLGAELRRREHQLAAAGAKDIEDYTDRRRRDPSLAPLPRLMIVVDEFASMIRELPDFVPGLVNIAQRGRSLGIHMVLATQRPSGAVTADIRANTNLRIALRTTDTGESRDIIDAPDAGELSPRTPGRAYARLSASALLPFQSGRIGGRRPGANTPARPSAVRLTEVDWTEIGEPVARTVPVAGGNDGTDTVTDIAVLVGAVSEAARAAGIPRQPSPSLPPLPEILTLREVPAPPAKDAGLPAVSWGIIDLPTQQAQVPLVLDLDRAGHLHIAGASRSGRSQALRTLAVALASAHSSADLHLYAVDCGNGALRVLSGLPHCGAVVDHRSPERLGRLLDRLGEELRVRQGLLGSSGVADLAELRERSAPGDRPAHIVVLVDRFEVYDRDFASFDNGSYLDRFLALLRDGASVGIHIVLTGDRVLGSSRYASTTEDKIVLRLNDAADWSMLGIRVKDVPDGMPPGRALRAADGVEVQVAVVPTGATPPDTSGSGQAAAISGIAAQLIARNAGVDPHRRPYRLLALPDEIGYAAAVAAAGPRPHPMWALVGVGGDEVVGIGTDLGQTSTFMIAGAPRSGRSTALLTMARSLLEGGSGVLVLAPRRSPLRDLAGVPGVAAVLTDPDVPTAEFREALRAVVQPTGVVLIDDAELLLQAEITADLAALARGAAGEGWAVVAAGNADALSTAIGGWAAQIRRNRTGLIIAPQAVTEGEAIGVRLPRGVLGQQPAPGRAYLHLGDNRLVAVQVPHTTTDN
ncbi:FtsK/SpoIIIE domain-containing protein [Streptomyces sp. TG1A-8]|uniref:FtsK/SpoIIIE domain-containing protein n=1 Tax=Streptomyces sp. TG1A-8 TaxID=3051385 RepID=UPI00265BCD09|nr:FtsK/SpoIIIE domain-containing protein [Streptomyces sp. TG1A-8]MDO0925066.1 FtsK/SpoIIIE domain-containing protein [Streptomyces sp. TG1A-8]